MKAKTYWQAMDKCGDVYLFHTTKPTLSDANEIWDNDGDCDNNILFPIPLKPLQIAEIKVNENGTWSYEIEREEGWYIVRHLEGNRDSYSGQGVVTYSKGKFSWLNDGEVDADDLKHLAISSTRIPDECII